MITFAFSFKMMLLTLTLTIGILSNQFISDIFSINNIFGQKPEIYIVQGAGNLNNNEAFDPSEIKVPVNTIVTWSNDDYIDHTITADDVVRLFDSGPISPDDTFDNTFDSAGIFGYHCSIHPFMRGIVMVE